MLFGFSAKGVHQRKAKALKITIEMHLENQNIRNCINSLSRWIPICRKFDLQNIRGCRHPLSTAQLEDGFGLHKKMSTSSDFFENISVA
jgi:hypothetical protein